MDASDVRKTDYRIFHTFYMIHLKLKRKFENDKQTLGIMDVCRDGVFLFSLATLELPWLNNTKSKSRIFAGDYVVVPNETPKHPNTFRLEGTQGRDGILIHTINYVKDLEGCIGVGLIHTDMNDDGITDVKYSTEALDMLRSVCKGQSAILLTIK